MSDTFMADAYHCFLKNQQKVDKVDYQIRSSFKADWVTDEAQGANAPHLKALPVMDAAMEIRVIQNLGLTKLF